MFVCISGSLGSVLLFYLESKIFLSVMQNNRAYKLYDFNSLLMDRNHKLLIFKYSAKSVYNIKCL